MFTLGVIAIIYTAAMALAQQHIKRLLLTHLFLTWDL
ncbi:hypothetical protein HG1285_09741, partial [Hydrogenivirga sp. 128-5-R1-1]